VNKIKIEEIKTVPIVLGESDILKIATTKAGVQTVGEGAAGFNVRGGKADQNLVLFNDAPVYNPSHFFGFFSVFNADAVSSMDLYKSGIPAKYGGRLSSIFSINSKEANKKEFHGQGGISPITSRLTLEIPLIEDKTSLLIGGRTTYSNWVLSRAKSASFRENKVSFFDVITRVDHEINDNNSLTFSSYISNDKFRLNSDTLFSFSDFGFHNINGAMAWNHRFGNNMDGKFSATYARYGYELTYDESLPNAFTQDFDTNETSIKGDLEYYIGETHKFSFGASMKHYQINPGSKKPLGGESIILPEIVPEDQGLESAIYFSDKYEYNEQLSLYGGIRYVMFNALGPATVYNYEPVLPKNGDTRTDSSTYSAGNIIKTYHGPEWRFSARYALDNASSLKLGLSRTRQYIHTLSNSASLSPTDTWRLSGPNLKPQVADQVSLGYYRNFSRGTIEVSVEGYYKKLQNLVDFKTGSTFLLNQNVEQVILQGPGKSYGLEFSVNKSGRLNGWINYAYARTYIKLDGDFAEERVNEGQFFPTAYDKPHTVNLVANYKLTRRLSFSVNATYSTGRPVTVPVAAFNFKGAQNIHFSDRNAFRIPDYFRVDLGINLEGNHKIQKLAHSFWSLSIYNLTGRDNPFSVFFDVKNGEVVGSQLIVFGNPIPTLSYNFKF
ncbi:MAG: TonB-dependent receptor plug domain-containing protein, partial [Cyclobacteriaceae bacterium]